MFINYVYYYTHYELNLPMLFLTKALTFFLRTHKSKPSTREMIHKQNMESDSLTAKNLRFSCLNGKFK